MSIFDRFQHSPFERLSQHMAKVKECVALIAPMFDCVKSQDYEELPRLTERVFKTEHEADIIKNDIRRDLPMIFSLPVYRGDLLAFLKLQDDIADSVEDVAVLLTIKNLPLPEPIANDVLAHVSCVLAVCEHVFKVTDQLRELVKEDFGGRRAEQILELVADAEHAEWEADKSQYRLARRLFALEDQMRATDIFLWSRVFQELGRLANHAEKTAERLRRMMTK